MTGSFEEQTNACLVQHIPKPGPSPGTVHDRAVTPVNAGNFLKESSHGVPSKTGTLKGTCDFMLLVTIPEVANREGELPFDGSIDTDPVLVLSDHAYCSMIAVVAIVLGDEAREL